MKKVRVWFMMLLCSVMALPLHANPAHKVAHETVLQQVNPDAQEPVALLSPELTVTESAAVLQFDKFLFLPGLTTLLWNLYFTGVFFEPIPPAGAFLKSDSGLHTILTAGP